MAFQLFPAEVWEIILGQLDDSKDVQNVFRAYPELEEKRVLKRKRHLWLFDQAIPHIFTILEKKEVLATRLVCYQWSHAVDNFLEHHPSKRAYDHENDITGQHWISSASRARYRFREYFHPSWFNSVESINKFLQHFDGHPPTRNPIVGRAIWITDWGTSLDASDALWNRVVDLFMQFGHHVWFIGMTLSRHGNVLRVPRRLLECLVHIPELKRPRIMGAEDSARNVGNVCGEFLVSHLSLTLPQLETLELLDRFVPPILFNFFIMGYSKQIRRLQFSVEFWKVAYSDLFPQLTELFLPNPSSKQQIINILSYLNSPKLHRLEIHGPVYCSPDHSDIINILRVLPRFPVISDLFVYGLSSGAILDPTPYAFSLPSLKSLKIWDDGPNCHVMSPFLKMFPNLAYLRIMAHLDLETAWGILPKLKEISVWQEQLQNCRTYWRMQNIE